MFLDTAPAIYTFTSGSPFYAITRLAMGHCASSGIDLVASPVTLAEGLAGEADVLRQLLFHRYLTTDGIRIADINAAVAEVAGHLRRTTKLKLADSLQLATAIVAGCDAFLTNDAQLVKAPVALRFVLVSDLEP